MPSEWNGSFGEAAGSEAAGDGVTINRALSIMGVVPPDYIQILGLKSYQMCFNRSLVQAR